jgi:hypothetical protein
MDDSCGSARLYNQVPQCENDPMSTQCLMQYPHSGAVAPAAHIGARAAYRQLTGGDTELARLFLDQQLTLSARLACDLPHAPDGLRPWVTRQAAGVAVQYRDYLCARSQGAARCFFGNRAHALYFLRCVAPTKLVDGAWLYWVLRRWDDNAYRPLVKTYLEELGEGMPDKNHVALYQRLLDTHACNDWQDLDDTYFVQGAIQLALGHAGDGFLPELIGYNLGYEQLPLHLLVTAYELNELGIDPYYFTLHLTVDNAATGHAHDAVDALLRALAQAADPAAFYQRVRAGYRLNAIGIGSEQVIAGFDVERELVRVLAGKAATGQNMHSDYCRVAGKTINAWLADTRQIPALLRAFEDSGWIKRGAAPAASRFWRLIQGERAEMFGVFSAYEQQVLADFIQGPDTIDDLAAAVRPPSFRARQRACAPRPAPPARAHPVRALFRNGAVGAAADVLRTLEQQVAAAPTRTDAMALLVSHMSPARHHGAAGLMATRLFAGLLA